MPGKKADKLINWFVEINRYLGWQPASGFIPPGINLSIQKDVTDLIDTTFNGDETAIRLCLSFVKNNFKSIIADLKPATPLSPVIYSQKFPRVVKELADRLTKQGCRTKFAITAKGYSFQTIPFRSLTELWNKNHHEIRNYGLAYYFDNDKRKQANFVYRDKAEDWKGDPRQSTLVNFKEMDDQDSRLFIFGLIVDLMQMGKMLIDDSNFMKQTAKLV